MSAKWITAAAAAGVVVAVLLVAPARARADYGAGFSEVQVAP